MERNFIDNKRLILIAIFLSIFILGTFLIFTTPSSIKITYGKRVETKDGEIISFNVFEPDNGKKNKPAILIGHGVMVNKEMLKGYAIELATAGYVAITFDFRGHGQSSGELNRNLLVNDVKAIKKYLEARGDIDMHKLGYIGYSMGGGPGNKIVKDDEDFKCFIGIGTRLDIDDDDCENRTLNILMILAKYDQAFDLKRSKKEIADRLDTDEDNVQVNRLYGSFKDGDATKLYLDDNSDHFLTAYDQDFIREARDWVKNTFPGVDAVDQNFYANVRFLILILQLIGGVGFFLLILEPLCDMVFKPEEKASKIPTLDLEDYSKKSLILKTFAYSLILAIPGMLLMLPFFLFLPLSTAGFTILLLYGQVFGVIILLWRLGKKKLVSIKEILKDPFNEARKDTVKHIILGAILAILLFAILYLSFGLNYIGIIPSSPIKLIWVLLYGSVFFIMYLIFGLFFNEVIQRKYAESVENTLILSTITFTLQIIYFILVVLILSFLINSLFFVQFFYFAIPIFYLAGLIFTIIYKKTQNILSAAIINTLFLTLLICTLSPYMLGIDMITMFAH